MKGFIMGRRKEIRVNPVYTYRPSGGSSCNTNFPDCKEASEIGCKDAGKVVALISLSLVVFLFVLFLLSGIVVKEDDNNQLKEDDYKESNFIIEIKDGGGNNLFLVK